MQRPLTPILGALVLLTFWSRVGAVDCAGLPAAQAPSCLAAQGWELVHDEDGVQVFTRAHPGSSIREVLARTLVSAPPKAVLSLLTDFDAYTRFMPATLERCKLLAEEQDTYYVFQQLDLPFVDDRFYTIRLDAKADPAGKGFSLAWTLSDDPRYQVQGRGSRVNLNDGAWTLREAAAGTATQLSYQVHTDPGEIWALVANLANRVSVPDLVSAVRNRVARAEGP